MTYEYDTESDCGYIYVGAGRGEVLPVKYPGHRTLELHVAPTGIFGHLVVDVTAEGRVLGIEVLGVTRVMPELIEMAKQQEA